MQRRVDAPQPRPRRSPAAGETPPRPRRGRRGPPRRPGLADQRAACAGRPEPGERAERRSIAARSAVHRRDDLRAVAEVELVAVVRGRVVARRDHDAGGGAQVPDGEGQQRRRAPRRQQVHPEPAPASTRAASSANSSDRCRASQPMTTPASPRPARRGRPAATGQRGRGGPDHRPVHPVRARADRAPQPGGAELQPAAEPVGKLGRGRLAAVVEQRRAPRPGPARRGRRRSSARPEHAGRRRSRRPSGARHDAGQHARPAGRPSGPAAAWPGGDHLHMVEPARRQPGRQVADQRDRRAPRRQGGGRRWPRGPWTSPPGRRPACGACGSRPGSRSAARAAPRRRPRPGSAAAWRQRAQPGRVKVGEVGEPRRSRPAAAARPAASARSG